jgi:hypothetical protein
MVQQPTLSFDSSAVTGQRTIRPNDAMTGNDHAHWIRTVSEPYGSHSRGLADLLRQIPITNRRSTGNLSERAPDCTLERRTGGFYWQAIKRGKISRKIASDGISEPVRISSRLKGESICAVVAGE